MKLFPVRDCKLHKKLEVIAFASDAVSNVFTNVALYPNQEGADPVEDHFVTSVVMTLAGETSKAMELSSEGGTKSSAKCQNQEPTESMTTVLPCEIIGGRTEQQEEELNSLDKPPGK